MARTYRSSNASSLPPRLPGLSRVIASIGSVGTDDSVTCTFVALSYRGFWKSAGRATQTGIEKDALAVVNYAQTLRGDNADATKLIIWGQSLGASVATFVATHAAQQSLSKIDGIILETPFISIKEMLITLYPERWLPYFYLSPFLWNHWDSEASLKKIGHGDARPTVLILSADKDEIVPLAHANRLAALCATNGWEVLHSKVAGALDTEASTKQQGRSIITQFIGKVLAQPEFRVRVKD